MAINKKVSREPLLINGSSLFYVFPGQHGSKHVTVDITKPSGMLVGADKVIILGSILEFLDFARL